jgi:hypothetical protein
MQSAQLARLVFHLKLPQIIALPEHSGPNFFRDATAASCPARSNRKKFRARKVTQKASLHRKA